MRLSPINVIINREIYLNRELYLPLIQRLVKLVYAVRNNNVKLIRVGRNLFLNNECSSFRISPSLCYVCNVNALW